MEATEEAEVESFAINEAEPIKLPWYKRAMNALKKVASKVVDTVKAAVDWTIDAFLIGVGFERALVPSFTLGFGLIFTLLIATEATLILGLVAGLTYLVIGLSLTALFGAVLCFMTGVFVKSIAWLLTRRGRTYARSY